MTTQPSATASSGIPPFQEGKAGAATLPVRRYLPARAHGSGVRVWAEMARELWGARELTWRLFTRDLSARYRQSVLGYLWALIPPLGTALLFTYLRNQRVLSLRETVLPYPAYVLLGMLGWQLFQGGLLASAQSLTAAGPLITRASFPRESLVLASLGGAVFDVLLRAVLVCAVFAWYGVVPAPTAALLPLVLLPLAALTAGLGFFLALVNALVRDVGHALAALLGLFFFLVPVIYPPPVRWPHVLVNDLNPVSAILIAAHDVVVLGTLTRPAAFAAACLCSALVFLAGWRVFRLAQPLVAERV